MYFYVILQADIEASMNNVCCAHAADNCKVLIIYDNCNNTLCRRKHITAGAQMYWPIKYIFHPSLVTALQMETCNGCHYSLRNFIRHCL